MDQLRNYTERHRRKNVKLEDGRILIEQTDQWEKIFRENEVEGGIESGNYATMYLICDRCSGEVNVNDCIQLKGFVLHRECARDFVEEILDRAVENPGSIDADTELHARMLRKQLQREGKGRLVQLLREMFQRRLPRGQR